MLQKRSWITGVLYLPTDVVVSSEINDAAESKIKK